MEAHVRSIRDSLERQNQLVQKLETDQTTQWRALDPIDRELSEVRLKRERQTLADLRVELNQVLVLYEEVATCQRHAQFGKRLFTSERVDDLRSRLSIPLSHEDVSTRQAGGRQDVVYIETFKALEKAQDVFGFDLSIEIKGEPSILYQQGNKIVMRSIVRVVLANGCYHEDLGVGVSLLNDAAEAARMAAKASVSDAIKRALQHFGPALGSCLKDKGYVASDLTPALQANRGAGGGSASKFSRERGHEDESKRQRIAPPMPSVVPIHSRPGPTVTIGNDSNTRLSTVSTFNPIEVPSKDKPVTATLTRPNENARPAIQAVNAQQPFPPPHLTATTTTTAAKVLPASHRADQQQVDQVLEEAASFDDADMRRIYEEYLRENPNT